MALNRVRVMISSRSQRRVFDPSIQLADLRRDLKVYIETQLTLDGQPVFDVWICEDDTGRGIDSWWETSREEVRKADLLLVLYTGEAGSQMNETGLGICHAELFEAVKYSREKVLPIITLSDPDTNVGGVDSAFQKYVHELNRWPNAPENVEALFKCCAHILSKSLVRLTQLAVRRRLGAGFDMGNALDWSKLDFATRKQRIETVLADFLINNRSGRSVDTAEDGTHFVVAAIERKPLLWCVHAIPAAASIAAARELVGQPFIRDHLTAPLLTEKKAAGPVHIIGCHKGITEAQALKIRGVADCTIVKTDFGIYLADGIQKIQILFLANCRDVTATQAVITAMFHWLEASEEAGMIVDRAKSRKNILKAIAKEIDLS